MLAITVFRVWTQLIFMLLIMVMMSFRLPVNALDNGLARTPPMGFLTWQRYRCNTDCVNYPNDCLSDRLIRNISMRMRSDGYAAAGYKYVIVDDCWPESERDPKTLQLVPDKKRFPNGMKALADFVHKQGLLFGIYEDFGTKTCAGYPGSEFYMETDTRTFAEWGVDYVKLDGCNSATSVQPEGYATFGKFMNRTNRPMVYSCSWPAYHLDGSATSKKLLQTTCNLWRIYHDISDSYSSLLSIINWFKNDKYNVSNWAGPGHWNDPDMLLIGNYGLSKDQQMMQMGMWAIMAAPLMLSADLNKVDTWSRDKILLNKMLISINQDPMGKQGRYVSTAGLPNGVQVWRRDLAKKGLAIAIINTDTNGGPVLVKLNWSELLHWNGNRSVSNHWSWMFDVFEQKVIAKRNFSYVYAKELKAAHEFRVNPSGIQMVLLTD